MTAPTHGERIADKLAKRSLWMPERERAVAIEIDQAIADAVREAKTVDVEVAVDTIHFETDFTQTYCHKIAKAVIKAWGLIAKEKQ